MDLSALGSTLPPGLGADVERDMGDKFRGEYRDVPSFVRKERNVQPSSPLPTPHLHSTLTHSCRPEHHDTLQSFAELNQGEF
jgi:hypothetical protein